MYFKCKQTGNVYFYQYEADILAMKEHHQYECLGEAIPEEPIKKRGKNDSSKLAEQDKQDSAS